MALSNPWPRQTGGVSGSSPTSGQVVVPFRHVTAPSEPVTAPLRTAPAPGGLRLWRPARRARVWWVGCHGGAGETTLSSFVPVDSCTDHRFPDLPADEPPAKVVLVARDSGAGLDAARRALGQIRDRRAGNIELLALVLSAAAPGKLPRELADDVAVLEAGLLGRPLRRIDWVPAWRLGDPELPRQVTDLLLEIHRMTQPRG